MAVFLTEGFFAGVDEGFFALVVVFALGLPGAVFFWRVEVVFELFFGGITLQCHELQVVRGQEPDTIRGCFQHSQG